MTDLKPHANASRATGPIDPLTGLRKMSTTAGVGLSDYVAINPIAIASTLLGLGSVLVPVLDYNFLLIIPIAAVVTAIIAWRQIRRSNGTQTGNGLALLGVVLAVLIGGGTVAAQVITTIRYKPDTDQVSAMVAKLGDEIRLANQEEVLARPATPTSRPALTMGPQKRTAAEIDHEIAMRRHYHTAYMMFSDKFRARVIEERFARKWSEMNFGGAGGLKSMQWNGHIDYQSDTGSGAPVAELVAWIHLNNSQELIHEDMIFTKIAGPWEIDDIPSLFPPEKGGPNGQ